MVMGAENFPGLLWLSTLAGEAALVTGAVSERSLTCGQ